MKNLAKYLFFTVMSLTGLLLTSITYADVNCRQKTCVFSDLTEEENKNPYTCQVVGEQKPSQIIFQSYNVLITGFGKNGRLLLSGDQVDLLSKYYFDAKKDQLAVGMLTTDTRGGEVSCSKGIGGRSERWPGPYGK